MSGAVTIPPGFGNAIANIPGVPAGFGSVIARGLTVPSQRLTRGGEVLTATRIKLNRHIATIIPDVVIEEQHTDRLTVTQHPVADGSPISDHAYRQPATLSMKCGFGGTSSVRAREMYAAIRKLQWDATATPQVNPISISTGKRDYENMVLVEISVTTDQSKEYSLYIDMQFQQVFMAKTLTTTQPAAKDMADAAKTSETQDKPPQQPSPAPAGDDKTMLKRLGGGRDRRGELGPGDIIN